MISGSIFECDIKGCVVIFVVLCAEFCNDVQTCIDFRIKIHVFILIITLNTIRVSRIHFRQSAGIVAECKIISCSSVASVAILAIVAGQARLIAPRNRTQLAIGVTCGHFEVFHPPAFTTIFCFSHLIVPFAYSNIYRDHCAYFNICSDTPT